MLVVDGGSGGIPAAVSSVWYGVKTMLIERHSFLGRDARAGNVGIIFGFNASKS